MAKFPYDINDLNHTLHPKIPTWDGSCGFEHSIDHVYDPNAICQFRIHKLNFKKAGVGTHMDAPAHCVPGGITIDGIKALIEAVPEDLKPSKFTQSKEELLEQDYQSINNLMIAILDRFYKLEI